MSILRRLRAGLVMGGIFGATASMLAPITIGIQRLIADDPLTKLYSVEFALFLMPRYFVAGVAIGVMFAGVLALNSRRFAGRLSSRWLAAAGAVGGFGCSVLVAAVVTAVDKWPADMVVASAIFTALGAGTGAVLGAIARRARQRNPEVAAREFDSESPESSNSALYSGDHDDSRNFASGKTAHITPVP